MPSQSPGSCSPSHSLCPGHTAHCAFWREGEPSRPSWQRAAWPVQPSTSTRSLPSWEKSQAGPLSLGTELCHLGVGGGDMGKVDLPVSPSSVHPALDILSQKHDSCTSTKAPVCGYRLKWILRQKALPTTLVASLQAPLWTSAPDLSSLSPLSQALTWLFPLISGVHSRISLSSSSHILFWIYGELR